LVVYAYHCPRADELERRFAFLKQVAESCGGEYDGWGVPVKR
jgi:regulator of RNase E activity RraB